MTQAAGSGIVQRFLAFLRARQLDGTTIGLAFSGGPDSTALAIAASEAAQLRVIRPIAIHVDHGVRPDSAADLAVVRETCDRLRLELRAMRAHLGPDASEDEMRVARYSLLSDTIAAYGADTVMTAHHAGDQAETVLLHAIRGSGLEGIAGISPIERWTPAAGAMALTIARPFLLEQRDGLLNLVSESGLPYLTDPTNIDRSKSRNAVRLDVLPALERIHPGAGLSLARLAEIARVDHDALEAIVAAATATHIDGVELIVPSLQVEHIAIQRRVVRTWVKSVTGMDLTWNRTEALRTAILSGRGGTMIELGEQWSAHRVGNVVRLAHSGGGREG